MGFEGVIGQEDVRNRLIQMVDEQRLPHALLFCGPKGCGKIPISTSPTLSSDLLERVQNIR